mgnify:CR=1 FL=1
MTNWTRLDGVTKVSITVQGSDTVLVVDIGAGTTDVRVLEYYSQCFELVETGGATVGGSDIDRDLIQFMQV